jgi:hypothetical protein
MLMSNAASRERQTYTIDTRLCFARHTMSSLVAVVQPRANANASAHSTVCVCCGRPFTSIPHATSYGEPFAADERRRRPCPFVLHHELLPRRDVARACHFSSPNSFTRRQSIYRLSLVMSAAKFFIATGTHARLFQTRTATTRQPSIFIHVSNGIRT